MINSVCNIHITLLQKSSVHYGIIEASELIMHSATDIVHKTVLEGIIIPMHSLRARGGCRVGIPSNGNIPQ